MSGSDGNAVPCAIDWVLDSLRNNTALMSLLNEDQTRIQLLPHDISVQYPAIGLSVIPLDDKCTIEGTIVLSYILVSVMGICEGTDISPIVPISSVMHSILQNMFNTSNPVRDLGTIYSCDRVGPVYYSRKDKMDVTWQYLGGQYRIAVQ